MKDTDLINRKLSLWAFPLRPARYPQKFETSDSAAIQLLPVLVERGYRPELIYMQIEKMWKVMLWELQGKWVACIADTEEPTIASAITSAILQLIEKEESK